MQIVFYNSSGPNTFQKIKVGNNAKPRGDRNEICFAHKSTGGRQNSQQKILPKSGQVFYYACLTFRYYIRLVIATRTLTVNAMAFRFCEKFPLVNI